MVAEAIGKSPDFREAMRDREIDDLCPVIVTIRSAYDFGNEPPEGR